jgi:hypothetical protein
MFPFNQLPPEIRLIIYGLDGILQTRIDGSAPPLLLALAADEVLYLEAKEEYRRTNISFSLSHDDSDIGNVSKTALQQIRHARVTDERWISSVLATNLEATTLNFKLISRRLFYCHDLQTLTFTDTAVSELWEQLSARNIFLWMSVP